MKHIQKGKPTQMTSKLNYKCYCGGEVEVRKSWCFCDVYYLFCPKCGSKSSTNVFPWRLEYSWNSKPNSQTCCCLCKNWKENHCYHNKKMYRTSNYVEGTQVHPLPRSALDWCECFEPKEEK